MRKKYPYLCFQSKLIYDEKAESLGKSYRALNSPKSNKQGQKSHLSSAFNQSKALKHNAPSLYVGPIPISLFLSYSSFLLIIYLWIVEIQKKAYEALHR